MPEPEVSPEQVEATIESRAFVVLMLISAIVGVIVSIAAWCFLELINQIQRGVYVHLPGDLGYHGGPPLWWALAGARDRRRDRRVCDRAHARRGRAHPGKRL